MSTWVVVKQGIYQHGVYGCEPTEAKAIALAKKLAEADSDDHHSWDVYKLTGGAAEWSPHIYRKGEPE